jgi:TRAP-type mannitol/chloroaromatic compound transport system permease large subunit
MELAILMITLAVLLAIGVPWLRASRRIIFFLARYSACRCIQRMAANVSTFSLMAIPFFVFAGDLMYRAGIAGRLVQIACRIRARVVVSVS